jgi:hypothetical protein
LQIDSSVQYQAVQVAEELVLCFLGNQPVTAVESLLDLCITVAPQPFPQVI